MSGHVFPCRLLCSFFTAVEILPLTRTQLLSCAGAPPVFERTKQLLLCKEMPSPALPPPGPVLSPAVLLPPLRQSWGRSDLNANLFLPTKLSDCSLRSCINWYQFQWWDTYGTQPRSNHVLYVSCQYSNPRSKEGAGMSLALISSSVSLITFFLLSHPLGLKWGVLAATPKTPRRRGLFFPVFCQFGHFCTHVTSTQIWETEAGMQTLHKICYLLCCVKHTCRFLHLCSHVYTSNGRSLWESHFPVPFILLFPAVQIVAGRRKAGYSTRWCESLSGEWRGCVCLCRASETLCGSENVFQCLCSCLLCSDSTGGIWGELC